MCGVAVTKPFTFPEDFPRLSCPQGSPVVSRGSDSLLEGCERRPKEPRRERRVAGTSSTRASVDDPIIPRKNGTFRSFRPQRGGGGTLRSSLGEATRMQPPKSGTLGAALRESLTPGVPPPRCREAAGPMPGRAGSLGGQSAYRPQVRGRGAVGASRGGVERAHCPAAGGGQRAVSAGRSRERVGAGARGPEARGVARGTPGRN